MHRELVTLADRLDAAGHHDLADAVERMMTAETVPGTQPSMQLLPPPMTTMRGPAGEAIVRDELERGEDADEEPKQVKRTPPRKDVPRKPGISIGVNVMLDSKPE